MLHLRYPDYVLVLVELISSILKMLYLKACLGSRKYISQRDNLARSGLKRIEVNNNNVNYITTVKYLS